MTDLQAEITRTMHSAGCYASDHTISKVMEVVEDAIAVRDGIIARLMPDQGDYGMGWDFDIEHRQWILQTDGNFTAEPMSDAEVTAWTEIMQGVKDR